MRKVCLQWLAPTEERLLRAVALPHGLLACTRQTVERVRDASLPDGIVAPVRVLGAEPSHRGLEGCDQPLVLHVQEVVRCATLNLGFSNLNHLGLVLADYCSLVFEISFELVIEKAAGGGFEGATSDVGLFDLHALASNSFSHVLCLPIDADHRYFVSAWAWVPRLVGICRVGGLAALLDLGGKALLCGSEGADVRLPVLQ